MAKVSAMEPNSELTVPEFNIRIERSATLFFVHASTEMHWCYNEKSVESHITKIVKTKMEKNCTMIDIFAVTNGIQQEIREMPVNTEKFFDAYKIKLIKDEKRTTLEANGESHSRKDATTLRPYIWDAVKLAADKMGRKARKARR